MRQFLLYSAFLITLTSICKANCPDVRLDRPGQPLAKTSVMDQDGMDICFAETASVLLDSWRFSHNPPKGDRNYSHLTQPLALAVMSSGKLSENALHSGGNAAELLENAKINGSCDPTHPTNTNSGHSELNEWLRYQFQEFQKCKESGAIYANSLGETPRNSANIVECPIQKDSIAKLPDLKAIEKSLGTENAFEMIKKTITGLCHSPNIQKVGGYQVRYHSMHDPVDFVRDLKVQFSKPAPIQPMAVGYCANILYRGAENYSGIAWKAGKNPEASQNCEKHESVVIGARPTSTGSCEVLIQNSWGTSCNAYPKGKCENGKIWIDAELLSKNTLETTHLEDEAVR